MKYDDLKFTVTNNEGKPVTCDILTLFPKDKTESLVVFYDDERDSDGNIVLKYGRLLKIGDDFELKACVDESDLSLIKEQFHADLVDLANFIIEKN